MRLPDEVRSARFTRGLLTVSLGAIVASCGGGASTAGLASVSDTVSAVRVNDASSDYPIVIGAPYSVGDTEYVPADTLNYDHVGYVTLDSGAMGYSGAHHTLPLPSYAEVTSLDTGRTILVRLERRGPMSSNHLVALSPAAMAQLGANAETAVRVRRVVPPEEQRFLLRSGQAAPLRMETPQSLLAVLQRRLPAEGAASLRAERGSEPSQPVPEPTPQIASIPQADDRVESIAIAPSSATPAPRPVAVRELPATPSIEPPQMPEPAMEPPRTNAGVPALPPLEPVSVANAPVEEQPDYSVAFAENEPSQAPDLPAVEVAEAPVQAAPLEAEGRFVVQAAAFANRGNAERVANVIGGEVTQAGRFFRVRTGPFATRGEAEASLANVRRAGYTDARIFTNS